MVGSRIRMRSLNAKVIFAALGIGFVLQLGCQAAATTKVELPQEQEAQKLLDAGLTFRRTIVWDGPALMTGCGAIDGVTYESSDGVEVSYTNHRCIKAVDALNFFEDKLKGASEVFANDVLLDVHDRPVGKRLVGAQGTKKYFITYLIGVSCPTETSPSLVHLLAFQKWRANHG